MAGVKMKWIKFCEMKSREMKSCTPKILKGKKYINQVENAPFLAFHTIENPLNFTFQLVDLIQNNFGVIRIYYTGYNTSPT